MEFLEDQIEAQTRPLRDELEALTAAVDAYVIDHYEPGDGYDDGAVRLTKVVGYRRAWNPDKLRKLLPTRLYKLVIDVKVNNGKLDELVREGKIDRDKIESAYEEQPNAPYVRRTKASEDKAGEEAAGLAAALS